MSNATLDFATRIKDNVVTVTATATGKNRNAVRAQINQIARRIAKDSGTGSIFLIHGVNPRVTWTQG